MLDCVIFSDHFGYPCGPWCVTYFNDTCRHANTLINAVIILPFTSIVNLVPRSWHCVLGTLRSRSEVWHTEQEAITGKKSLRVYSSNEVHFPFHSLKSLRKIYRWQPLWGSPNMEWKLLKKSGSFFFWGPGWSEDLHGLFTATIILWLKQSYLCHLESLMVMTFSFTKGSHKKMCLMNDFGNLLLKNSVLCFTASVLIIMDMSCLKWSLISGFQMCFPTIWVTIIFAVNFSRQNQTEFSFVQTSSVYLNGQSITFMIHLSQNEILIEWCCHFRELSFFKLHFELMWGLLYSSRRMRWDYMVDGAGRQSKEKSFFHHDPIFSCVYNFWNLSRIIQATAKRAVV